jgi:hypothetical protein
LKQTVDTLKRPQSIKPKLPRNRPTLKPVVTLKRPWSLKPKPRRNRPSLKQRVDTLAGQDMRQLLAPEDKLVPVPSQDDLS